MASAPADKASPLLRTPRAVINEAIRENAGWDIICRWGVVVFGLTGVVTILGGLWQGSGWLSIVGAIPAALCWPAVHYARSIRRENVSLRLLELALNNVQSADEALLAINKAFAFHFAKGEGRTNVVSSPKT